MNRPARKSLARGAWPLLLVLAILVLALAGAAAAGMLAPAAEAATAVPPPPRASQPAESGLAIASFNIRALSDRSRSQAELAEIAALVEEFDLVAIQESRDTAVLVRLVGLLEGGGAADWEWRASPRFKSGGGELYAWVWRQDRVEALGEVGVLPDRADVFIREPAWLGFRGRGSASGLDFVLINYHALFGDNASQRRQELSGLPAALQTIQDQLARTWPGEADFWLAGDFNMPASDRVFDALRSRGMAAALPVPGTTIADSPYDNFWRYTRASPEYAGNWGVVRFDERDFGNDDARAGKAVSDHRPVWIRLSAAADDD